MADETFSDQTAFDNGGYIGVDPRFQLDPEVAEADRPFEDADEDPNQVAADKQAGVDKDAEDKSAAVEKAEAEDRERADAEAKEKADKAAADKKAAESKAPAAPAAPAAPKSPSK